MTKKIYTFGICWMIAIPSLFCQRAYDLRQTFMAAVPEHQTILVDMYSQIDSLRNPKNKVAKQYVDSLLTDSLVNTLHGIGLALRMDMFAHYHAIHNTKMAQSQLLAAQQLAMQTANSDTLMQAVHQIMATYFAEQSMWEAAAKSWQTLGTIRQKVDRQILGALEAKNAEQQQQLDNLERLAKQQEATLEQYTRYTPFALGGAALLLLLLIWTLLRSTKWKNKWRETKQLMDDRLQAMDETQKMSIQFKNEGAQFKQTAEAAIGKMNEIEQAKVMATRQVQTWRDESTNELIELKDLIEEMKNNPSVSSYMQIQNQLSRFQTKNKEMLGQVESVLRR